MSFAADPVTRRAALARAAALLGGALSASTIAGVMAGCGDSARPSAGAASDGGYRLRALTPEQDELVAVLSEHILPRTDTPGAREVGVNRFVDAMLATAYPPAERALFLAGLGDVDDRARRAHGRRLVDCTASQQVAILTAIDGEAYQPAPATKEGTKARGATPDAATARDSRERTQPGAGETPLPPEVESGAVRWRQGEARQQREAELPFWHTMKELTLVGYYTSEVGATKELRYAQVPGHYRGCVPFSEVGRTWAV